MKGDIETYYLAGEWNNRAQGDVMPISVHDTKAGAVAAGRALAEARQVEHIIKGTDGTVRERKSYPRRNKG